MCINPSEGRAWLAIASTALPRTFVASRALGGCGHPLARDWHGKPVIPYQLLFIVQPKTYNFQRWMPRLEQR
jgi:hypothetical protein